MSDETTMQAGDDPADFTVEQVIAHLATADDAERTRVLASERGGKGRKSLLEPSGQVAALITLPPGAEAVSEQPGGRWARLVDATGRPVTVDGAEVAVPLR